MRFFLVAATGLYQVWAFTGDSSPAGSSVDVEQEDSFDGGMPGDKESEEEPNEAIPASDIVRITLVSGEQEDSQTYEEAKDACQTTETNGDSWHLCFKDEVEDNWNQYLLKAGGAYGFRAWVDEGNFTEAGCIYNGRRTEATAEQPNWACGYQKDKKFNALCCVDMADVALRTAGNMNSQNFTQAQATCAAYRSHLCDQGEAASFVANLALGATWVAWGAKGCTIEAAKKNWTCGDEATQANPFDALCCVDQDLLKDLWPSHLGDPWNLQDRVDCSNKAVILGGSCNDYNGQLSLCGGKLENRSGSLVHCVVDLGSGTCRPSKVQCHAETCVGACRAVR
mmetsp:Transcript_45318/g.84512  ORF Transcript_45318/g.84512 Transcript_45318/m.84512 type:complete len:339 (+) Transcript_45318:51-1067(+)